MNIIELLKQPWPWYISGPLIGLIIPALLILGNKTFGISSSFRHICAACFPAKISFFQYMWKKEIWNLLFVFGIFMGAIIATQLINDPLPVKIHQSLTAELASYGITDINGLLPVQLFSWTGLLSLRGFLMIVGGGFLIGFGTRYAGGCTSGHSIMGLSTLQWPSLIATCCFMLGGIITANFILPYILSL